MPSLIPPLHPDGWRFVAIFAAVTIVLFWIAAPLGWIGVILTLWCAYFFRSPERVVPSREGLIVSPADGKIVLIEDVIPPEDYEMGSDPRTRVSVFLNVFDVHVNRIPLLGKIKKIIYHPGVFVNASLDKASDENERQTLVIEMDDKERYAVTQIAGLVARRIVCEVNEGDDMSTGQLYGLIRFGSRVDIYLPKGVVPQVVLGQTMISGESIIADMKSDEGAREGEMC